MKNQPADTAEEQDAELRQHYDVMFSQTEGSSWERITLYAPNSTAVVYTDTRAEAHDCIRAAYEWHRARRSATQRKPSSHRLTCEACSEYFSSKDQLLAHWDETHRATPKYLSETDAA